MSVDLDSQTIDGVRRGYRIALHRLSIHRLPSGSNLDGKELVCGDPRYAVSRANHSALHPAHFPETVSGPWTGAAEGNDGDLALGGGAIGGET